MQNLSFEEFKLYYESTERVTERRLSANTWNYSICVAIIIAIATIIGWSASHPTFFYIGLISVIILCSMAVLLCSLWVGQIDDFKHLNNAKFKVLNEMAPHIEFDPSNPGAVTSFCPFEREWQVLQEIRTAVEIAQGRIIALKSSNIEYFIPKAFRAVFLLPIIGILIAITLNWNSFVESWKALLH